MRHGERAGYRAGCREACCRRAQAQYISRWRAASYLGRTQRRVNSAGTIRRLRGLMRLGHTLSDMSLALGHNPGYLTTVLRRWEVREDTAEAVRQLTKQLVRKPPPKGWKANRARRQAEAKGYLPLAVWNDIDNPHETPDMEALAC